MLNIIARMIFVGPLWISLLLHHVSKCIIIIFFKIQIIIFELVFPYILKKKKKIQLNKILKINHLHVIGLIR